MEHEALHQLLCAATINSHFRDILLHDPARALAMGYSGQSFPLTAEEKEFITNLQARDLEDFAAQVHRWLRIQRNNHKDNHRQDCLPLRNLYRPR